jgi:hypothetical protein
VARVEWGAIEGKEVRVVMGEGAHYVEPLANETAFNFIQS